MVVNATFYGKKTIPKPSVGYCQSLKFITSVEELNENGRWGRCTFERDIKVLYAGRQEDLHRYQVFCADATYVLERMALPDQDLLRKMAFALDEVVISTDEAGNIVRLHNHLFVKYRWTQIREQLFQDYDNERFKEYITQRDRLIGDYAALLSYLQLPSVYGLYFNGYLQEYEFGASKQLVLNLGEEVKDSEWQETLSMTFMENGKQELACLDITGRPIGEDTDFQSYTGKCQYLDGILEQVTKHVDLGKKRLNYKAKWHGLKTYFR